MGNRPPNGNIGEYDVDLLNDGSKSSRVHRNRGFAENDQMNRGGGGHRHRVSKSVHVVVGRRSGRSSA